MFHFFNTQNYLTERKKNKNGKKKNIHYLLFKIKSRKCQKHINKFNLALKSYPIPIICKKIIGCSTIIFLFPIKVCCNFRWSREKFRTFFCVMFVFIQYVYIRHYDMGNLLVGFWSCDLR
jgi:hypothetical protein